MNGAEKAEKSAKGINISLVHCPAAVEVGVGGRERRLVNSKLAT
jgi:hypothetical protein